ncbi:SIR2 family protein [Metabacillus fastidiosus]|uniref:SIR2 family protein n=1 Tax=Metabacillus fastidiosus TaxID=1458 RepID=UPI003D2790FD
MEKVVYVLGAGFSAPLGLPVMTNFILRAKDMYFKDKTKKYEYFKEIFDLLDGMSKIKNYFSSDLYNIEEVLSVLEMNDYLNGSNNSEKFKKFISDVIRYYTPEVKEYPVALPGNWQDYVFGAASPIQKYYGSFVANLLGVKVSMKKEDRTLIWESVKNDVKYSVVSFNYDLVLESYVDYFKKTGEISEDTGFNVDNIELAPNQTILSKLHGCVNKKNIVPPTWNKYSNQELITVWENAWNEIKNANHIRIIGYSLPVSDSYIKYFLKSCVYGSDHLKSIDVLTLDKSVNEEVRIRYEEFIDFNYFRFKNANFVDYVKFLSDEQYKGVGISTECIHFNELEVAHEVFMDS